MALIITISGSMIFFLGIIVVIIIIIVCRLPKRSRAVSNIDDTYSYGQLNCSHYTYTCNSAYESNRSAKFSQMLSGTFKLMILWPPKHVSLAANNNITLYEKKEKKKRCVMILLATNRPTEFERDDQTEASCVGDMHSSNRAIVRTRTPSPRILLRDLGLRSDPSKEMYAQSRSCYVYKTCK